MRGAAVAILLVSACSPEATLLDVSDPTSTQQLVSGFHEVEGDFRWTAGSFVARLNPPRAAVGKRARLVMQLFVPEVLVHSRHDTELACALDEVALPSQRYDSAGPTELVRDTPPLSAAPAKLSCTLSHPMPPGPTDQRELGIVVTKIRLIAR